MSISIERSVDDPIVRVTWIDRFHEEGIQEINTRLAEILRQMGSFYVILDIREAETTFGEIVALLNNPQTFTLSGDSRIKYVFVGQPVPHDPTNKSQVPVFSDDEQALEYIRKEIADGEISGNDV